MTKTTKNTTDIDEAVEAVIAEAAVAEAELAAWMASFPSELAVEFRNEIGKKTVTLENKSQEWILWALTNGLRQSIADAIAGKAGTEEGKKLILAKYERVCDNGEVPSGGGGGGAKLSINDAAWIAYFKSKGSPIKFKGETPNGKNLNKYQLAFTRKAIWPSISAHLETLDETSQREFHATKLDDLIKNNKELVIKKAESGDVKKFIDAEKLKREGKKPEQSVFSVDIEIQITS